MSAILFMKKKIDWVSVLGVGLFLVAGAVFVFLPKLNQVANEDLSEGASAIILLTSEEQALDLSAKAAILVSLEGNRTIFSKNPNKALPIASLTKLMTATVVLDNYNLNDTIIISKEAVDTEEPIGGLLVGGEATVQDLLAVMFITSSNDAAVALAENYPFIDGSREEKIAAFVEKMNEKSRILGLVSTVFFEPTGLAELNLSSARDLTGILKEAAKYPLLVQFATTREFVLQPGSGFWSSHLSNTNKLLEVYDNLILGKTGFTDEAMETLAILLSDSNGGDDVFAAVVLGSEDRDKDMKMMVDWAREKVEF
jgi:D-alanyl-D-alanine endopeptidase (penicillin-binding protein 7)